MAFLAILFAHATDLLTTYIRTPDLSREIGPLYLALAARGLGGWPTMIGIKVFAVALSVGLFVLYLRRRRQFYPSEPGLSFRDFLHHTHSLGALRLKNGRWLAPSPLLLAVWLSFTGAVGTAAFSYGLAISNLLQTPYVKQVGAYFGEFGRLVGWAAHSFAPAAIFLLTAIAFWCTLYNDYHRVVGKG